MPRDLLDGDDCGETISFTVNEDYASKYSNWREKEVLETLKNRYKNNLESDDSSSSEDDEPEKNPDILERDFFRTLSFLKKKDPCIYNEDMEFYERPEETPQEENQNKKSEKDKPIFLRDYERNIIINKEGKLSDDDVDEERDENDPRASSPTYVEEQKALKESFKHALENFDGEEDEDDADVGNMFKKKIKTAVELKKEEEDYMEWLKGRKDELQDKNAESDLKVLHDYWNNPNLNPDEAYLRDYLLNKRFLEPDYGDLNPEVNDEHGDLEEVEKQEKFEHKFNFRFQEPDAEFIKRYPRNMEVSLRRKDDRRKIKRQEIRERKEAEKNAKREEIKQLKALKRKEIIEKIEKIKEVTGNDDVCLNDEDLEDDFNPEEHDKKMKQLFNDDYYEVVENEKPEYQELDDELEIENWDSWTGKDEHADKHYGGDNGASWQEPECEDPNFNMDCDYDPKAHLQEEMIRASKSRKKQKRKSKLAEAVARSKPVFDPNSEKFEEYFEEYYKLDCEDIIGDLPCRFKYRKTTPNNYGLTIDEILTADIKELNRWCSLKKCVKYKPDYVEKYEVKSYHQKSQNEAYKRKMLPSLYNTTQSEDTSPQEQNFTHDKKKKKKKKKNDNLDMDEETTNNYDDEPLNAENEAYIPKAKTKKRKHKYSEQSELEPTEEQQMISVSNSFKDTPDEDNSVNNVSVPSSKKRKHSKKSINSMNMQQNSDNKFGGSHKGKFKKRNQFKPAKPVIPISDKRLEAYGLNPKKFKNKIKYGNKDDKWNVT